MSTLSKGPESLSELEYKTSVEYLISVEREKKNFRSNAEYLKEKARATQLADAAYGVLCTKCGYKYKKLHGLVLERVT